MVEDCYQCIIRLSEASLFISQSEKHPTHKMAVSFDETLTKSWLKFKSNL